MSSAASADPRRPEAVTPFKLEQISSDQAPIDLLGIVAIVLSMYCVLMKNPYAGWASLFSVVISIANTKYSEAETKSNLSTLMFAVMGIIMNYLTVIPPAASGTTGK